MALREERELARSPGISYQELLDTDSRPVPDVLRLESTAHLGSDDIPVERYTSRTLARPRGRTALEAGMAVRMPRRRTSPSQVTITSTRSRTMSFLVIRTATGDIKAYPNACLHRGRRLKDQDGHCSELRCPFHGFAWHLDGALKDVPARWDFPHVERRRPSTCRRRASARGRASSSSTPILVPRPLEVFVEDLATQFEVWDLAAMYKQAHVARELPANWKIAQEAFCEAFHVNGTHPQILPYLGDTNSQVDIWDNCARVITPGGTPSPLLDWKPTPDEMMRAMLDVREDEELPVTVANGETMRSVAAELSRSGWRRVIGQRARCIQRRRAHGQHRLHPVPELPSLGRAQPHRLPLPAERRRPPKLDHGRAAPRRRSPTSGRRRRPCTGWLRTSRGRTRQSSVCSGRCSSRTSSTWATSSAGWRPLPSPA